MPNTSFIGGIGIGISSLSIVVKISGFHNVSDICYWLKFINFYFPGSHKDIAVEKLFVW